MLLIQSSGLDIPPFDLHLNGGGVEYKVAAGLKKAAIDVEDIGVICGWGER